MSNQLEKIKELIDPVRLRVLVVVKKRLQSNMRKGNIQLASV